jgi:hypothetical protein
MPLDPAFLSNAVLVLTAFAGACGGPVDLLVIWTYRDVRRRSADPAGADTPHCWLLC